MQQHIQIEFLTDYSEICRRLGRKEIDEETLTTVPQHLRRQIACFAAIKNLEDYFNSDWILDWENREQRKWYPYFDRSSGGWVFYGSFYRDVFSTGLVGFYKDKETSDHIGRHFMKFYIGISERNKKRQDISIQL